MEIYSKSYVNAVKDFVDYIEHEKIIDLNLKDKILNNELNILQHGIMFDDYSKVIIPISKKINVQELNSKYFIINDKHEICAVDSNVLVTPRTNEILKVSFVNLGTFILKESNYLGVITVSNKPMLQQVGFCKPGDTVKTFLATDQIKSIEKCNDTKVIFNHVKLNPDSGLYICNVEDSFDYLFVTDTNNQ